MIVLTDALAELKNKLNLQYIDLDVGAVSLNNVHVEADDLANIKTETCTSGCVTTFNGVPQYVVPELPIPTGVITFGIPKRGYTAISQPFSYSGTDASHFTATVDDVSIGIVTSPILLTGLDPNTSYEISVTPVSVYGEGTEATTNVTTVAIGVLVTNGVGSVSTGIITFGTPTVTTTAITQPFSDSGGTAMGYYYRLDNSAAEVTTSPIELVGLDPATVYNIKVAGYNNAGISTWYQTNVQTLSLPDTPIGTITFGTPTITDTTITQPFSYNETDATHFIATVNGASIGTVTSPIELTGLEPETLHTIVVVPVNAVGLGNSAMTDATTLQSPFVEGVLNLQFEAMYFHETDIELIPNTHNGGDAYVSRISSDAKYDLQLNGVSLGVVNLNNAGGVNDALNFPSALTGGVWLGSPYSRYSKLTVTLEQANLIAGAGLAAPPGVGFALIPLNGSSSLNPIHIRMVVIQTGAPEVTNVLYFTHTPQTQNYTVNPQAPNGYTGRTVFAYVEQEG